MHDDHLVRRAGEDLAREGDVADRVGDARDGGGEIEIASIRLDRVDVAEGQAEIAERLVRHLRQRLRHHARTGQRGGVGVAPIGQQAPHLRQRFLGLGVDGVVGAPGPERALVQLQPLVHHAAEHHRSQPSVAHGQGTHPLGRGDRVGGTRRRRPIRRRLAIPQAERLLRRRGFALQAWRPGRRDDGRSARQGGARHCHERNRRAVCSVPDARRLAARASSPGSRSRRRCTGADRMPCRACTASWLPRDGACRVRRASSPRRGRRSR